MNSDRNGTARPWWLASTGIVAAQIAALVIVMIAVVVSVGFDDFPSGSDEVIDSVGTEAAGAGQGVDELVNLAASDVAGAAASVTASPVFVAAIAGTGPGGLDAGTAGVFGVGPGGGGVSGGGTTPGGQTLPPVIGPPGGTPPGGGQPGEPGGPGEPGPTVPGSPPSANGTGNPLNNILWAADYTVDDLAGLNPSLAPTTEPVTDAVDEVLFGATGNDLSGHLHTLTDPVRDPPILGSKGEGVLGTGLFPP